MKENLPAHHYPQRARNLGLRQMPKEAEKAQEPRLAPAAARHASRGREASDGAARQATGGTVSHASRASGRKFRRQERKLARHIAEPAATAMAWAGQRGTRPRSFRG